MQRLKKIVEISSSAGTVISALFVAFMMFLTTGDVLGRALFNRPISGTFELTRVSLAIIFFLALGTSQLNKENISITILFNRFPDALKRVLNVLIAVVNIALFSVILWQMIRYALRTQASGLYTSVLRMPVHPWIFLSAVGVVILLLVLAWDFIEVVRTKGGEMTDES